MFWPFTVWKNCSSDFKNFAFSLEFQKFFSITRTFCFSQLVRTILVTKYHLPSVQNGTKLFMNSHQTFSKIQYLYDKLSWPENWKSHIIINCLDLDEITSLKVRNFVIEGVACQLPSRDCKPLLYYKLPYLKVSRSRNKNCRTITSPKKQTNEFVFLSWRLGNTWNLKS